jgi:hypothetical protein
MMKEEEKMMEEATVTGVYTDKTGEIYYMIKARIINEFIIELPRTHEKLDLIKQAIHNYEEVIEYYKKMNNRRYEEQRKKNEVLQPRAVEIIRKEPDMPVKRIVAKLQSDPAVCELGYSDRTLADKVKAIRKKEELKAFAALREKETA